MSFSCPYRFQFNSIEFGEGHSRTKLKVTKISNSNFILFQQIGSSTGFQYLPEQHTIVSHIMKAIFEVVSQSLCELKHKFWEYFFCQTLFFFFLAERRQSISLTISWDSCLTGTQRNRIALQCCLMCFVRQGDGSCNENFLRIHIIIFIWDRIKLGGNLGRIESLTMAIFFEKKL